MERDWEALCKSVCEILHKAYVEEPLTFAAAAAERGTSVESLVAAAICGMLREAEEERPAPRRHR